VRTLLALLLLLVGSAAARAQCPPVFDWRGFYPPATLDRVARLTAPDLRANFEEVMLPRLTDQERRALGNAHLDFGEREYRDHPLNFYAAEGGRIVMPLASIRLVRDLMLALAWSSRNGMPERRIFDYAAMLAWRGPAPDGVRVPPLVALGVPEDADSDPAVAALFQKMYGATLVFIMAHEAGHLFHRHRGGVVDAQSRQQETEADTFAIDLMARIGAAPVGVSLYFMMAAPFECTVRSTHPLSGTRIRRLADAILGNAALFSRDKPSPAREMELMKSIAADLATVATLLDDPDVRAASRLIGLSSSVASFAATKEREPARQAFDGAYKGHWTDAKGMSLEIQMMLQRQQQTVRGKYQFGLGAAELEGIVTGDQLDFAWRWGSDYFGRGRLRATADGRLEGTWGYTQRVEGGGSLSVTRHP